MTGQPRRTARLLVVEHEAGCPPDRLAGWLAEAGVDLDVRRPWAGGRLPDRVGPDHDGLLVLGGSMGAQDDAAHPWLPPLRALLAESAATAVPVLGVCLGAQLLAVACGGAVRRGAAGIEAGVVDVCWRLEAAGDPLVGGLADPFPGPSMHQDAIVALPPGAVWLGQTAQYPHQAFRVGRAAWGVQFHPEVSLPTFRQWARDYGRAWDQWEAEPADVLDQLARRDVEVAGAGRALAERFAALVRTSAAARSGHRRISA